MHKIGPQVWFQGIWGSMAEGLRDHRLRHPVFQHGGCQVVPEDVGALPAAGLLPYPGSFKYLCNNAPDATACQRGEWTRFG